MLLFGMSLALAFCWRDGWWVVDSFEGFLGCASGKESAYQMWVLSQGWEDPLEKGRATHSSIVAWRIPWTEDPGRLQSMGMQRVRHNWVTKPSSAQHKDTHVTFHKEHCSAGFFSCDVFVRPQCQSNNDQICRSYDMFFSVSIFWNSFGKISIL